MSHQFRVALKGTDDEVVRHKDARAKLITRIAFRPSERVRRLTSTKADPLSGYEDRLYKGEDLKRGSR